MASGRHHWTQKLDETTGVGYQNRLASERVSGSVLPSHSSGAERQQGQGFGHSGDHGSRGNVIPGNSECTVFAEQNACERRNFLYAALLHSYRWCRPPRRGHPIIEHVGSGRAWGRRVLATTCCLTVLIAVTPTNTYALLGLGDVVFDPSSFAMLSQIWQENIAIDAKLMKEISQLVTIANQLNRTYHLGVQMAQQIQQLPRLAWSTVAIRIAHDYTQSVYGETILWPNLVNGMPGLAAGAWQQSTQSIKPMPLCLPVTHRVTATA
jgi:hypothetical protein